MSLLGGSVSMAGDIWSTGAFSFESPLKDLLDSKNYTLEQLLAEDELLQELRGLHPILTDYFATEQAVTKLIRYITLPPTPSTATTKPSTLDPPKSEVDAWLEAGPVAAEEGSTMTAAQRLNRQLEKRKSGDKSEAPESDVEFKHIRFPYMACEIICCEIEGIINTLVDGFAKEEGDEKESKEETNHNTPRPRILDLLFNVLYDTPPGQLDDYRAGYFDKILSLLFRKRALEMSSYINSGGTRGQQSLMEAMMKHLYSHSIMQICQRLLLPPRPIPKQTNEDGARNQPRNNNMNDTEAGDDDDEMGGGGGGQDILAGEEDEGENGAGIKCDWSKSGIAIDMLLQRLIYPETLLETESQITPVSAVESEQSIEEQRLNLSLNASEVLITVIQNSMLSSETMLSLTSFETMQRLSAAATTLKEGEPFQSHESLLTSAMNVVESLILQLGGYGAVGTMAILEQAASQDQETNRTLDSSTPLSTTAADDDAAEIQAATSSESSEGEDPAPQPRIVPDKDHLIADLTSLLQVLPEMLKGFAALLRHKSTQDWQSPVQFSKNEPVKLLGTSRLRIVRVLESLVLLGDPAVDSKLVQSDCLRICLDLFWEFQWCSMLHQSVANLLVHVFEGQNARFEIQNYFISRCNLIGRLMNSFVEITDPRTAGIVMDLGGVVVDKLKDGTADVLPVSEDDIDAALEKQEGEDNAKPVVENVDMVSTEAVGEESNDASTVGASIPAQSFRFGYMGHVIIICQALVQACANEWAAQNEEDIASASQPPEGTASVSGDATTDTTGSAKYEPLMIADLVNNHGLSERWQDFVISTLASEIAVQSTPLGGMSAQPTDPLQAHRPEHSRRPGLADDGDIGDGAMAPPVPRGMISGSEIHDLDDSDLEAAANMMAGLNLGRPTTDEESEGSGDSQRSYNSGETNNSGGYMFEDPLGQGGSLGIELGKLTQYAPDKKAGGGDEGKDDSDGNSSSDEEPQNRGDDSDDGSDPPTMDLFAGNFNHSQGSPGDDKPDNAAAFDFADFSSFEGDGPADDSFGEFSSADATAPETPPATPEKESSIDELDTIFVSPRKFGLLDEIITPEKADETPAVEAEASGSNADDSEIVMVTEEAAVSPSKDPEMVMVTEEGTADSPSKDKSEEPATDPTPATDNNDPSDPASSNSNENGEGPASEILASQNAGEDNTQKEGVLVS